MRNHHYEDVSNLNAPYDSVALQGLGAADDARYPWREFSDNTLALQSDLNEALTFAGGCLVLQDGQLGPRTCGALNHFEPSSVPSTCFNHEAMIAPKIPCPPEEKNTTPAPDLSKDELVAPGKDNTGLYIGIGLGVVAIAAAILLTRKKK